MATKPIDYVVTYYGTSSWRDLVIRWNGTGTQWKLTQIGEETPLYEGPDRQFLFTGLPNTRYDFRVETVVDSKTYQYDVLTYTTALPAPIKLTTTNITSSSATLSWDPTVGVDGYDIADVKNSYTVIGAAVEESYAVTGLAYATQYSYAVRSTYKDQKSKWSNPISFFTRTPDHVDPGEYEFAPISTYTWRAGRAGSSDPSWAPAQANWAHGDGLEWGDLTGVNTTYFFFGAGNPFSLLAGAVVSKCEVFIDRFSTGGDPGPVLSRIGLHTYKDKPDGEPKPTESSLDVGVLSRGESAWFEVPVEWATQLIIGAYATGWYWGNCQERYELAKNYAASNEVKTPRIGMVRITVS